LRHCKDGIISWRYGTGLESPRQNLPFLKWLENKGVVDEFLGKVDWDKFEYGTTTQEIMDRMEMPVNDLFMKYTKAELFAGASFFSRPGRLMRRL
jgi:hypothetical protein